MLRERKKLNERGSVLGVIGALALLGGGVGLVIAVTNQNRSILNFLRLIFLFLDSAVYTVAGWAYSIFYEVSYSSILSSLNLSTAAQRLYTLLGIFMLFRLAFAFVKYIINPDGMEKGSGKLMTNLAVSLALIVSTPWIFNRAFELQTYIMDSNVIGNLIMGMNTNTAEDDGFNAGSYGQVISFLTFSAFYHPDSSIPAISSCGNLLNYYSEFVGITEDDKLSANYAGTDAQNKEAEKIAACVNELNGEKDSVLDSNSVEIGTRFFIASQRYNMGLITHSGVYEATIGESYVISYTPLVSTIAGGFLALLFLNFCFDVAVRNVKLCFLQIIAPIPIILNIEPGDSKNKSLSWWGKECLRTYVDLFIRVATVYFGVFLINQLFGNGMSVHGSTNTSAWFKVFMILGILLFVKQIPDMIGKAFGIDMKGNFSLNPLKRIGDNRIASMALGGAAGLASGFLGGAIAGYQGARGNGATVAQALRHSAGGALGGGAHSMWSGGKKGVKSLHDITSNATQNWARSGHIAEAAVGTSSGRVGAAASMTFGAKTAAQRMEDRAALFDSVSKNAAGVKSAIEGSKDNIGPHTFGAGNYSFAGSNEVANFLKNNTYYDSADQNRLTALMNNMRNAENFVAETSRVELQDGTILDFANDSEVDTYARTHTGLATEDYAKLSATMTKMRSREFTDAQALLSGGGNVNLSGITFDNAKDIFEFGNVLNASNASNDVKQSFGTFAKGAANDAFTRYSGDMNSSIGVAQAQLSQVYGKLTEEEQNRMVDPVSGRVLGVGDFGDIKGIIGASGVQASNIRTDEKYQQAKRDEAFAKSRHGGK